MSKKLHVLFLCSWFPSRVFKTNGDFIERHAQAVALLHKVSVLHLVSDKTILKSTVEIETTNNVTAFIGYVKYTPNVILKSIRFFKIYKKLLKQIGFFDVVHLNTLYPFSVFALHIKYTKKIKFIISEHWTGYLKSQQKKIGFFKKMLAKSIVKNATFVCPVSTFLKTAMQQYGLTGNYAVVGNVVDTDIFKPTNKKGTVFTLVHVSNLSQQKNIAGMLRTAKLLEDKIGAFTFKFIGGKPDNYLNLLTDLNFKIATIQFINHLPQEALAKHIQQADACVSFSNYETFGIVLTEAIACGVPVIATKTGIATESFLKEFIYTVDLQDENGLLKAFLQAKNKSEKVTVTTMHKIIASQFSNKIIAQQFSKLYYKMLNNTP